MGACLSSEHQFLDIVLDSKPVLNEKTELLKKAKKICNDIDILNVETETGVTQNFMQKTSSPYSKRRHRSVFFFNNTIEDPASPQYKEFIEGLKNKMNTQCGVRR